MFNKNISNFNFDSMLQDSFRGLGIETFMCIHPLAYLGTMIILIGVLVRITFISKRGYALLIPILCSLLILNSSSIRSSIDSIKVEDRASKLRIATFNLGNTMVSDNSVEIIGWPVVTADR